MKENERAKTIKIDFDGLLKNEMSIVHKKIKEENKDKRMFQIDDNFVKMTALENIIRNDDPTYDLSCYKDFAEDELYNLECEINRCKTTEVDFDSLLKSEMSIVREKIEAESGDEYMVQIDDNFVKTIALENIIRNDDPAYDLSCYKDFAEKNLAKLVEPEKESTKQTLSDLIKKSNNTKSEKREPSKQKNKNREER